MTYVFHVAEILILCAIFGWQITQEGTINQMATKADLDAAIAALPDQIAAAVEAALAPIIQAIKDKSGDVDLSDEITALGNVGSAVATKVSTDLTPPPTP